MIAKRNNKSTAERLCVFFLILISSAGANEPVKVFLLGGQANMLGIGKPSELAGVYAKPQADVRFWKENTWGDLAPAANNFGPEIGFGRAMKDALPKEDIYLVKYAAGGTALYDDWSPSGGPQYLQFIKTAQAAVTDLEEKGVKYEIAGMLWMQGESDAHENEAKSYEKNLRDFIAHMREQFKTPEMPFVIARVTDFYGGRTGQAKIVRDAQQEIAESTDRVEWFDTDDYPTVDGGHCSGKGLVTMGKDFAKAILSQKAPEPTHLEEHSFNSADGKNTFVAVLTGYDAESGIVSVRKSGLRIIMKFKIDMLLEEDQEYVKEHSK